MKTKRLTVTTYEGQMIRFVITTSHVNVRLGVFQLRKLSTSFMNSKAVDVSSFVAGRAIVMKRSIILSIMKFDCWVESDADVSLGCLLNNVPESPKALTSSGPSLGCEVWPESAKNEDKFS
ncbi:hypothetical protein WICPIJ_004192 [Wickerhamomyces pijperi]|uniref:Uncharacterized protein n=1 Tax=Wickerhamomyces pijperi TaxID=599730 RepID=A0A9P8Q8J9_WICPI|nr:hypothetical protein WICPIJ_004192 [Wickerhamomyces pijperi]